MHDVTPRKYLFNKGIGKLIGSDSVYNSIAATAHSLELASQDAQALIASLADFSRK